MPGFFYGGIYSTGRNEPVDIPAANPLPSNKMSNDTGNAGADGYTVLSRASRFSGERPPVGGYPVFEGPQLSDNIED